ncbi:hypothetical protein BDV12DRAFT_139428 [Aspergillus spectabilis]
MKLQLISSLLPLLAAAAPASSTPNHPPAFTVTSSRSASPIHLLPLNAAGQSFYLGGSPTTYCPLPSGCPTGNNSTVFAGNGGSLSVTVPGGQQIYVSPAGALKFTQAHSANIPPGSSRGPFEYIPPTGGSASGFGHYEYQGWGASGFMACPTEDSKWQVFAALQNATVPGGDVSKCLGFSAVAVPRNETGGVWQYV